VLATSFAFVTAPVWGDTISWLFSVPDDYVVSDSTKVEIAGGVARLVPVDQTDDDAGPAGFGGGAHSGTQWDAVNEWLELVPGGSSGYYTSRVMDAGAVAPWDSISWVPARPSMKELPNSKGVESAYAFGNADMTGNVFLAHLDESPVTHGTTCGDSSGESNDATMYTSEGAADKSCAGKLAGAVSFDGVDDYLQAPDASALDPVEALTVEAWLDPEAGGGTVGEIASSTIDSYEYDVTRGRDPDVVHVSGDVYAFAYGRRGDDNDGWLFTTTVSGDGTLGGGKLDSFEFGPQRGNFPDIFHVSGNVYAIAYSGPGGDGWIQTITIAQDGTIGSSAIDSFEFDPDRCVRPCVVHVSGDVYAIAYEGPGYRGELVTLQVAADGTIGSACIDTFEFDSGGGSAPKLFHVAGDVYAIAYSDGSGLGWIRTVSIATNGTIGNSAIDSLQFESVSCAKPDVVHVSGDVYAVVYTGPDADGWIVTVGIATDGTLAPAVIDRAEFDAVYCVTPDIARLARDVYAIAYGGPGSDGWLVTGTIADDGTIGDVVDTFEFDTARGTDECVFHVSGDVYGIAYCGPGYDGWLVTVEVLTERGIVKSGSYGVDADTATVCAWVNDSTLCAAASVGWNHVALVYDRNAGSAQQKLYVNGTLASTASFTDSVRVGTAPLVLGKRFSGKIDEVAIFDRALSPTEIADHYRRGAAGLKFQVRSGSTDPPSGPFVGPDGTSSSYYSELSNTGVGLPSLAMTGVAPGRFFQYRAYLETDDLSFSPELESVTFGRTHYPGDNPTVRNSAGTTFASLASFAETMGGGNAGTVRYQISNDGTSWYYWDGANWSPASGYAQTNTAADVSANCALFDDDVGDGEFYFKAFLHSDSASQAVELDRVDLSYAAVVISVSVDKSTFAFGTRTLDTWLPPDSTVAKNDGNVSEDFTGRLSQFSEGASHWEISDVSNGADTVRAQWSDVGPAGPWNDIAAYDSSFTIRSGVAVSDSVTVWFRILTPTSTSSFGEYSATFTVMAQKH